MKKNSIPFIIITLLIAGYSNAQVGISKTNTFTPNAASILDVSSTDKGILIPRVALTSTIVLAPVTTTSTAPTSLLVYNTETAGTSPNNVVPGFYYWETDKWIRISNVNPNDIDLRLVGTNNHITKDAGVGGTGTSAGTGTHNIAIGSKTLNSITTGYQNIAIGQDALTTNTTSFQNIAIGQNALKAATTATNNNVAIGVNALSKNTYNNITAVGYNALASHTTGWFNTAVGSGAGANLTTAQRNTIVGNSSLASAVTNGLHTTVGYNTLNKLTSGVSNTVVGYRTMETVTSAEDNTIIGGDSFTFNSGGADFKNNTFIGADIGIQGLATNVTNPTMVTNSVGVGQEIMDKRQSSITTIRNSTFLGYRSGPLENLIIPTSDDPPSNNPILDYATAIGANAFVGANHSIVLGRVGSSGSSSESQPDKVGIGVIAPTHRLHVKPFDTLDPVKIEGLKTDNTATNIVVADTNGVLKTVAKSSLTSAATEPWLVQGSTTTQASANTQNIYQMGKVAIGAGGSALTGDSASVMLHVNGDVESTGRIYSGNSIFADYVFEKYFTGTSTLNDKYTFNTLGSVKDFVKKNHHLPGVKSIKEIKKTDSGYMIDLAELSIQQLEKIEELYLHVIEQQEQIDEKNKEIEKLKSQQELINEKNKEIEKLKSQQEDLNSRLFKLEELLSKK